MDRDTRPGAVDVSRKRSFAERLAPTARRLRTLAFVVLAVPIVLLIRILRPVMLGRVGGLKSTRIGHFAANTEMYLCRRDLDPGDRRSLDLFYLPAHV